jgi:hypothetical protein
MLHNYLILKKIEFYSEIEYILILVHFLRKNKRLFTVRDIKHSSESDWKSVIIPTYYFLFQNLHSEQSEYFSE